MRLIKRIVLDTGLVILKLTQPLIPAENPNSSNFYGTEGVANRRSYRSRKKARAQERSREQQSAPRSKKVELYRVGIFRSVSVGICR